MLTMLTKRDGYWEPDYNDRPMAQQDHRVLDVLLDYTPGRHTAVTVGANVGLYEMMLAREFDRVIAFEPVHETSRALARNTEGADNVFVMQAAGWSTYGSLAIHRHHSMRCGRNRACGEGLVPALPVDALRLDECDLILIDVEGGDFEALKGCKGTMVRCKPAVALEVEHLAREAGTINDVLDWLPLVGYRVARKMTRDLVIVPDCD